MPSFISGAVWSVLNAFLSIAAPFFMFTVSAFYLSPVEVGAVAMAVALCELVKMIAPQGLYEVLMAEDMDDRRRRLALGLLIAGGLAASLLFLIILVPAVLGEHLSAAASMPLFLLVAKPVLDVAMLYYQAELARQLKFRHVAMRSIIANVVAAAVGSLLVAYANPVFGMVAYYLILSGLSFAVVFWGAGVSHRPLFEKAMLRQSGEAWFSTAVRNLATTNNYIDQFITGLFVTPALLGFFSFGKRFETALITGGGSLANIVYQPVFSQIRERNKADTALAAALSLSSIIILVPVMVFAINAEPLIHAFFGERWLPAVPFTQLLIISGAARVIGQIYGGYLSVTGHNRQLFGISFISAAASILALALTPWIGLANAVLIVLVKNAAITVVMAAASYGRAGPMIKALGIHCLLPLLVSLGIVWTITGRFAVLASHGPVVMVLLHSVLIGLIFAAFNVKPVLSLRHR